MTTNTAESDISAVSSIIAGNGLCGCNGNCTCNEGFSGDICECRPNEECRDPVGREVSSHSVYYVQFVCMY